jgi:hypothetical protein
MLDHNEERRESVYEKWSQVLDMVKK